MKIKMNLSTAEISELICTRISHDLIGNIGAVSNAVELLEEGDMEFIDDIRSILKVSSSVLSSRLKFFRMAFGSNNTSLEKLGLVASTTQDYLKTLGNANYPINLEMRLSTPQFSKVAMLAVMIVADTMIRGGKIEVEEVNSSLAVISFAQGVVANEKIAAIKELLQGNMPENLAQYAPIFYLQELLKSTKYKISIVDKNSFGFIVE